MVEATKYRMTFKCSCGNVFQRITTNPNLTSPPCPECKKANKKTKFHRLGDGPVPSSEKHAATPTRERPSPNTIYKCDDCNSIARIYEDVGETLLHSCPACCGENIRYRGKISKDIATDSSIRNKCVDKTAEIVMSDYKMSDLKDNVRPGETMAPKLAPRLQTAADGMFGGGAGQKKRLGIDTGRIARAAMSGALRDPKSYVDPVAALHKAESRGRA